VPILRLVLVVLMGSLQVRAAGQSQSEHGPPLNIRIALFENISHFKLQVKNTTDGRNYGVHNFSDY